MTKAELIDKLHATLDGQASKRLVAELVDGVFEHTASAIRKDGRFAFPGFGTFVVRRRKARNGRNPQTGEKIKIKASKTVGFRPARVLKEKL